MTTENTMLSTSEAAQFLGIKVSYLHKLMMRRIIPYYKPNGKKCYFDPAELDRWRRSVRIKPLSEIDAEAEAYVAGKKMNL
ncbi:helix-turn-helix domain-containing protein [Bacteroides caecigallinarum]|uniref:helix-turn-helix domain-containing protein n=1 Tax=Bacteroides caecigallinarum TaxID=1411144 RepID=UPI001F1A9F3D|nr:helix-turn-helix domain-containing protein [Bacteroides caecigallinarum]MCF2552383.1 helix-turn-helix domain-containing protein [Bacteroides caecigallinarum]